MFFFFNAHTTTEMYTYGQTLSLHDALQIWVVVLGCDLVDFPARLGRNAQFNCPRKLDLPGAFEFGPSDCDTRCICETWVQPFFIGAGWGRSAEDQFEVGVGLDQLRKDRCVITGFCVLDMMSFVDRGRKRGVEGKGVAVRVAFGGRRFIK